MPRVGGAGNVGLRGSRPGYNPYHSMGAAAGRQAAIVAVARHPSRADARYMRAVVLEERLVISSRKRHWGDASDDTEAGQHTPDTTHHVCIAWDADQEPGAAEGASVDVGDTIKAVVAAVKERTRFTSYALRAFAEPPVWTDGRVRRFYASGCKSFSVRPPKGVAKTKGDQLADSAIYQWLRNESSKYPAGSRTELVLRPIIGTAL